MAHLHRLIRLLAVMLLTVIPVLPVQAQQQTSYPATLVYRVSGRDFTDVNEYCRFRWDAMAYEGYTYVGPRPIPDKDNWFKCVDKKDISGELRDFTTAIPEYLCKSGGSLQGRICLKTCPEGQELQPDGTCKPKGKQCTPAGEYDELRRTSYSLPGKHSSSNVCIGGCEYESSSSIATSLYTVWTIGMSTGKTCVPSSGGETLPKDDPRVKCIEKGMSFGEANGKIICVPKGNSGGGNNGGGGNQGGGNQGGGNQGGGNQGGGNQGGGGTGGTGGGTGDGGGGNGSGNGSGGGNGSGNGSGGGGGGGNNKNDMENFCAKHPDLPLCKKSSYSGSGCDQPPKCDGDAVQCAQAHKLWQINCDMQKEPDDDAYKLGKSLVSGGNDPLGNPLDPSKVTEIDVASVVSEAAGQRMLSGTCIQSPSFSVMGRSYTLDTTKLCEFASIVGYLMVAISSIIAIRMISGGST